MIVEIQLLSISCVNVRATLSVTATQYFNLRSCYNVVLIYVSGCCPQTEWNLKQSCGGVAIFATRCHILIIFPLMYSSSFNVQSIRVQILVFQTLPFYVEKREGWKIHSVKLISKRIKIYTLELKFYSWKIISIVKISKKC